MFKDIYKCADENEMCNVDNKPSIVAYGTNGSFIFKNVKNKQNIPCTNDYFGNDPMPGKNKQCYIKSLPTYDKNIDIPNGFIKCAENGGTCFSFGSGSDIIYGTNGSYTSGFLLPGHSVVCDQKNFPGSCNKSGKCYIKKNPNVYLSESSLKNVNSSYESYSYVGDTLLAPLCIDTNKRLESKNGRYKFFVNFSGELCFIDSNDTKIFWSSKSKTDQRNSTKLCLQMDGNLVLFDKDKIIWSSDIHVKHSITENPKLVVENNGSIVVYTGKQKLWSLTLPKNDLDKINCTMPNGSWTETCNSMSILGSRLKANCKDKAGSEKTTYLDVRYCDPNKIWNDDGKLTCSPGIGLCAYNQCSSISGPWIESCVNPEVNKENTLFASCKNDTGQMVFTSLDISKCQSNSVNNNNGKLECKLNGDGFCTADGKFMTY